MKKKIVSIIGTGVIGAGWAARFLAKGYIVKAYDPNIDSLQKLKKNIRFAFKSLKKIGLNKHASLKKLKVFTNLNDALHFDYVKIEISANYEFKKPSEDEINRILDKIGKQGIGSLTKKERESLDKATDR